MKAVFTKGERGFFPNNIEAQELFDKLKYGENVMVESIKTRNYENHKRFFALINVTFDIQDKFTDPEQWRKMLEIMAGHYEPIIVPLPKNKDRLFNYLKKFLAGTRKNEVIKVIEDSYRIHYIPKSISFESMPENEFQELFTRIINAFLENYGNGMTENQLYEVINFV